MDTFTLADFQFGTPWALALLALIPLLALRQMLGKRRARPAALRYSSTLAAAAPGASWRLRLRPLLDVLRWATLAALVLGLARPQFVQAREIVRGQGVHIALALDISGSMASLDFEPDNRLEAAKRVIDDFIRQRPYDQIGLVVFAHDAFNQSPPTVDHDVLRRMLIESRLATQLNIEDGTAIGMGLANAANMLKDADAPSRVVILLTDGVNNAGEIDPLTAAEAAQALGIKVYTVGMGRPGPVPVPVADMFGRSQIVMQESAIDEEVMQAIAVRTGGRYYRAEDTAGLQQIYDEISALEQSEVEIETFTSVRELMALALVPGALLLLAELLLRHTLLRSLP